MHDRFSPLGPESNEGLRNFLQMMARMENAFGNGDDEEDEEEDEDEDDDDSIDAPSKDDDDGEEMVGGLPCAICFRKTNENGESGRSSNSNGTDWRRHFVHLPCCGQKQNNEDRGIAETSTTRFCAGCLYKLATRRPASDARDDDEYNDWESEMMSMPHAAFYDHAAMACVRLHRMRIEKRHHCRVVECPRCRDLVTVKIQSATPRCPNRVLELCTCPDCELKRVPNLKQATGITLKRKSFAAAVYYAGRKRGMAPILFAAAHLHHSFLPLGALGDRDNPRLTLIRVKKLCSWNVLRPVPGQDGRVFSIKPAFQQYLRRIFCDKNYGQVYKERSDRRKDEYTRSMSVLQTEILCCAFSDYLLRGRLFTAVRLFNRIAYLFLYEVGLLPGPPLPPTRQSVATTLSMFVNAILALLAVAVLRYLMFIAAAALQGATIILFYLVAAYVPVVIIGSALFVRERFPRNAKALLWRATVFVLFSYVMYRIRNWFGPDQGFLYPHALSPARSEQNCASCIRSVVYWPFGALSWMIGSLRSVVLWLYQVVLQGMDWLFFVVGFFLELPVFIVDKFMEFVSISLGIPYVALALSFAIIAFIAPNVF